MGKAAWTSALPNLCCSGQRAEPRERDASRLCAVPGDGRLPGNGASGMTRMFKVGDEVVLKAKVVEASALAKALAPESIGLKVECFTGSLLAILPEELDAMQPKDAEPP